MKRLKNFLTWLFIYLLSIGNPYTYSFADIAATTLPTGGNVISGNVTISIPEVGKMDVNQTSNQGIVNWDTFNVGSSASVHFNQPTSRSSILNNVLSGQSIINGSIFSNGRLILVNPTGILTGPTSAIRSEGAILSTLNLTKQNYLNSTYNFSTNNNSTLINEGNIEGEYVALLSPIITNKGTINTNVATSLAAGDNLKLSISDSNLLTVSVNPSKIKSSINNEGNIKSQNGIVTLKTDIAQSVVDQVIKIENAKSDGLISENGIVKLVTNTGAITAKDIKIDAGSNGASTISGTLNSNSDTSNGGSVEVTAKEIDINTATISADGKTGGGKVLIGGDWQGSGDLLQATYLNIDSNSKITANALTSGSGGTIVAWSDIKNSNSLTTVSGTLEAKGIDGSGGQIETSGADLNINGIRVNTSSVSGSYGNWLVDPTNLTIDASAASTYATNLSSTDVTLTADNTITLNNNISYSGSRNSTLTFDATTTVLNANITSSNGTLSIDINTILEIGATNTTFTTNGGNVDISGVIRAVTGENSNNFTINAGTGNVTFSSNVVKQVGDYSAGFAQGNFTSISDLDFSGTFLNAINIAGTATTIGDVTFQDGRASNNTSNANESFQHEIQNWNSRNYGNTGLNNIMKGIRWSGGTGHSPYVQFTNATAGQKYKIQALFKEQNYNRYFDVYVDGTKIVDDFRPLDAGSTSVNRGRYLTYQFEAASTNVMFRLSGRTAENSGGRLHGNDVNPILNAISIEAVDAGAAINNLSITANQFSAQAIEVGGDLTVTNSGGSTISGVISGDTALVKAGTSSLTTSANNTYTGGTTVSAGTLFGGAASRSNDVFGTGSISVASGATLWIDRSDDGALTNALTLNGGTLRGTNGFGQYWDGNITLGAHSTIKADNNLIIDGVISGSSKNLTKTGNGNLLLRGNNTYTGSTTISAGTLTLSGSGNLGAGSYAGAIANSGTFKFDTSANLISTGVISGSGAVNVSGAGIFEPTATNTYTGGTIIDGGKIAAKTDRNFGANPSSDDPDNILLRNTGTIYFGSVNSSNSLAHVNFGYNNNRGIYLESGQHNFIDGSGGNGRNKIYSVISGVGGVTYGKTGNKTMTIYSANTYTGDTRFNYTTGSNNGVHIANADAWKYSTVYLNSTRTDVRKGWSVVSGGSINFGGLAGDATNWRWQNKKVTFGFNNQDTTFSGSISQYNNSGYDLVKVGTGTTTFSNTNTNANQDENNGIDIQAGKVKLAGNWGRSNDSNGNFKIATGATLEIDSSISNTFDGVLSGTGTLILGGTGTQDFAGNNTFTGTINIADGGIKASHVNALGATPVIISSGGRISTASSITLSSLTVTGNVQLDSGITTTGAQIYNNNVVVKAGSRATAAEISTTNSNISFKGTLKGEGNAKARSLNIDAGTGNVLFGDRVGYAFNDEVVNINNTADSFYKLEVDANEITIKGDVMTYEEQIYNGDVLIGSTATNGTTRTFLSMDPKVEFNGTVNDTVKGKHTLIAKAIEIDRGANSIPVVNFNSTVGRSTALAGYNGLTGYQVINRNYGTINNSVPVGTKKGLGQTMGPVTSSNDRAKKAEKGANQITKILRNSFLDTFKNISFSGNTSIGFKKSVEIVYGDSSDFGKDINPKPRNNTQGFFNNFEGARNNLATIKSNTSSKNDFSNDNFNKAPRDIKELFLKGPGGKIKASFLNPNTSKENPDLGACEVDQTLSC